MLASLCSLLFQAPPPPRSLTLLFHDGHLRHRSELFEILSEISIGERRIYTNK